MASNWLPDLPEGPWLWLAGAVAVLAVALWAVGQLRQSSWLSGIGPQAFVALGGVAVSVHGLWGFATQTSGLPTELAVAFISVFDAAEMTLLVMMYRAADPEQGWTRELRLMHRTAWVLVAFSAAMNAVHAPNWWARPVLAAVPALAAWLIELQLRSKLHHVKPGQDDDARPGPARLVALLWQHAWAELFALLGLDARTSSSAIARAALVQRAALRVYRLRLALDAGKPRKVGRRRRRAQKALDRADVAVDSDQALALARRLATLTGADAFAALDYRQPDAVLTLIENLAITPAVQRQEASALTEQAREALQRAEAARQEAEDARQRAADELTAAREELARVRQEQAGLLEQGSDATGRAEAARQEEQAARQRAEAARQDEQQARQRAQDMLADAQQQIDAQRQTVTDLYAAVEQARADYQSQANALRQLNGQIQEAQTLYERLRGDLAGLHPQAPDGDAEGGQVAWKSPAKQDGWAYYVSTLSGANPAEPTAAELAERFGVDPGNARNWLRDFRAARATQLAAQPRALSTA
ncbi:DUF2637 domain-containing protein [Streptomyces nigra]|uniref:DUF2637 domain-containing protein n=1 Tax=Streptomyces nigra TaxID=1827580 RepID=UPI000D525B62|nr:DUF2637 domain-containing protein [Streptomyces nigra]AWE51844.1 hypothetical protein DC008_20530 [Streptomyces nigra]